MANQSTNCEDGMYIEYDEELEKYVCGMDLDEDDTARFLSGQAFVCPYYRFGDEYQIVKHQM